MLEGMNTNNPSQLPSNIFVVKISERVSPLEVKVYHDRHVNLVFEEKYLQIFKIVPPCVGAIIHLERPFMIDIIEFIEGKVVLWLSPKTMPKCD